MLSRGRNVVVGGEKHECPRKKGRDFIYLSRCGPSGGHVVTHGWRNCFMTRLAVATARPGNAVLGRHRLGSNPTPTISACIATSGNLQEVYLSPMCFTVGPWIHSVFLYSMLSTSTSGRSSHLNVVDVATVPPSTRASQHAIDLHGQLGSHAAPL